MPLFIVNGSVSVVMNTFDGITNWIVGMILVDRANKSSRKKNYSEKVHLYETGQRID